MLLWNLGCSVKSGVYLMILPVLLMMHVALALTAEARVSEITTRFGVTPQMSISLWSLALAALMDAGHQSLGFVLPLYCFSQDMFHLFWVQLSPHMKMQLSSVFYVVTDS